MKNVLIVLVLLSLAVGCSEAQHTTHTIKARAISCAVKNSPCQTITPGDSERGRYLVFSVGYTDIETGEKIGNDDGYCIWVNTNPDRLICTKAATFEGGTINYGGLFVLAQKKNTFSIHGGTGKFAGAKGIVNVTGFTSAYQFEFLIK